MRALFDGQLDEGELLARDAFEVGTRLQLSGALQAFVVQTFFLAWQRGTLEPLIDLARVSGLMHGTTFPRGAHPSPLRMRAWVVLRGNAKCA